MSGGYSAARIRAILAKEFVQMRHDRLTFAIMMGVPVMELILFIAANLAVGYTPLIALNRYRVTLD